MKRLALIGFLALGTAFGAAATAANASPAPTSLAGLRYAHSGIILADYDRDDRRWHRDYRRHWHGNRGWRGDRYRGWHRYHSRPYNWRARGCVVVGPVWVCP